jgi:hypothetical protein
MTFEELTQPYIDQFGEPDQTFEFDLDKEKYVQWYWYKIDVVVEFVCLMKNMKNGWEVSFAFSMDPLKYFKKKK